MSTDRNLALIRTIKKIPLFKGLVPKQVQMLLGICATRTFEPGERVCGSDTQSLEMFILISGTLEVKSADGVRVATVEAVSTVGELGVVMKQPRSATVDAMTKCSTFVVPKTQLELLMQKDPDMQVKVFRNVIEILGSKILNDNIRTRDHTLEKMRLQKQMNDQKQTTRIVQALALKHSDMSEQEMETYIAEQKRDSMLEILIVDDEAEIRQFAKEALSGASVMEAEDGKEAMNAIYDHKPDLVITDIRMPKMDGYTLLGHLRELYPDLPVLAISGMVSEAEAQAEDQKFNGFIEKGAIDLQEFRTLVEKTAGKKL